MITNQINLIALNAEIEKLILSMKAEDKVSLIGTQEKTINGGLEILVTLLIIHYDVAFVYSGNETIKDITSDLQKKIPPLLNKA